MSLQSLLVGARRHTAWIYIYIYISLIGVFLVSSVTAVVGLLDPQLAGLGWLCLCPPICAWGMNTKDMKSGSFHCRIAKVSIIWALEAGVCAFTLTHCIACSEPQMDVCLVNPLASFIVCIITSLCISVEHAPSNYLCAVLKCGAVICCSQMINTLYNTKNRLPEHCLPQQLHVQRLLVFLKTSRFWSTLVIQILMWNLVLRRMKRLEHGAAAGKNGVSAYRLAWTLVRRVIVCGTIMIISYVIGRKDVALAFGYGTVVGYVFLITAVTDSFQQYIVRLQSEANRSSGAARLDALWASGALRREKWSVYICGYSSAFMILCFVLENLQFKWGEVEILSIDNTQVRKTQVDRLEAVRASRDNQQCQQALDALKDAAGRSGANLLEYAIEAARARATVGEISLVLEAVFGRYQAEVRTISGVYGEAYQQDEGFQALRKDVAVFADEFGRRPRILVAKLGQDGHDRGARIIATGFADVGFDVDIGPLFQTPQEVVQQALDNDVHVIGISSQAAGHTTLVPKVLEILAENGESSIKVVLGGVVPKADRETLAALGVAAFFGPGTPILEAAREVFDLIPGTQGSN